MGYVERDLAWLAQIFACHARVLAMQAANAARADQGYAQAYSEESFWEQSQILDDISRDAAGGE